MEHRVVPFAIHYLIGFCFHWCFTIFEMCVTYMYIVLHPDKGLYFYKTVPFLHISTKLFFFFFGRRGGEVVTKQSYPERGTGRLTAVLRTTLIRFLSLHQPFCKYNKTIRGWGDCKKIIYIECCKYFVEF